MPMHQPVHPGEIIKHDCLEPLSLSVTAAAEVLGVARSTLSKVVNGRASVSPMMAVRLSKAFGSSPEMWLRLQLAYDVAQTREQAQHIQIPRYWPAAPATS